MKCRVAVASAGHVRRGCAGGLCCGRAQRLRELRQLVLRYRIKGPWPELSPVFVSFKGSHQVNMFNIAF
jgi:hypothetical protein